MYEFNDVLEKYGKELLFLELKTLCFVKDGSFVHLASVFKFVETSKASTEENRNGLIVITSYLSKANIEQFFSDLKSNILVNKGRKIIVSTNFDYPKLRFSYYTSEGGGNFMCVLYGGSSQGLGNDLLRGVYSFGASDFQTLAKDRLGMEINTMDGSIFIRLPVSIIGSLSLSSKEQIHLQVRSHLDQTVQYSMKFYNLTTLYIDSNEQELIQGNLTLTGGLGECDVPVNLSFFTDYDQVLLSIFDTDSGILLISKMYDSRELLARSSVFSSVLREAYSLFRNPIEFNQSILTTSGDAQKIRPQDRFELEISRLLNCAGLQAVWLGENDSVKKGSVTLFSADILAYDDRTGELYIISCKTGAPISDETANKVIDAKNQIESLLQRNEIKIRPCIITLQQVDITPFMRSQNVILINKSKLDELIASKSKFILE